MCWENMNEVCGTAFFTVSLGNIAFRVDLIKAQYVNQTNWIRLLIIKHFQAS